MAYPTLKRDSTMPFGKYKGWVMKDIPSNYIDWLINNTDVKVNLKAFENKRPPNSKRAPKTKLDKPLQKLINKTGLSKYECIILLHNSLLKINKIGKPTIHDWDDEVIYEKPKEYYGQIFTRNR